MRVDLLTRPLFMEVRVFTLLNLLKFCVPASTRFAFTRLTGLVNLEPKEPKLESSATLTSRNWQERMRH